MLRDDLRAVGAELVLVFKLHMRSRGHTYGYEIVDAAGRIVGHKSVHTYKGERNVAYTFRDVVYDDAESFLRAYHGWLIGEASKI